MTPTQTLAHLRKRWRLIGEPTKGAIFGLVGAVGVFSVVFAAASCAAEVHVSSEPSDTVEATPTHVPVFERPCARWQLRRVHIDSHPVTLPRGWEPVSGHAIGDKYAQGVAIGRCIEAVEPSP